MICKVVFLNKKSVVPVKLGSEWKDISGWWPEFVQCMGPHLSGKVLIDTKNKVAVIGVIKFKRSPDNQGIETGISWLKGLGWTAEVADETNRIQPEET